MKPNFALSLSHDGITLLHRTGDGWATLGAVALDCADLNGALAELRQAGQAVGGTGFRCKIVLPNDQIRYLALDNPRVGEDAVRAALDGTTPYAVDDLIYDFRPGGGRMHVAAVARETLDEAETFAADHGFAPVGFVAVPEPFTFPGEPFLGPTRIAAAILPPGEKVEADDRAVTLPQPATAATEAAGAVEPDAPEGAAGDARDAGPASLPQPAPDPAPAPAVVPADLADPGFAPAPDPAPAPAPAPGPDPVPAPGPSPGPVAGAMSDSAPPPPDAPRDTGPVPDAGTDDPPPEKSMPPAGEAVGDEAAPEEEDHPPVLFASRSRTLRADPAPLAAPVSAPPAPGRRRSPPAEPAEPVFTRREPVLSRPPGKPAALATGADKAAPPPGAEAPPAALPDAPPTGAKPRGSTRAASLVAQRLATAAAARAAPPEEAEVPPLSVPLPQAEPATPPPSLPGQRAAGSLVIAPADRAAPQRAGGAIRPARTEPPRRRRLGLVLTLVLIAILALVAWWSTTLENGFAGLFGGNGTPVAGVGDATGVAFPADVVTTLPLADTAPDPAAVVPDPDRADVAQADPAQPDPAQPEAAPPEAAPPDPVAETAPDVAGTVPDDPLDASDLAALASAAAAGQMVTPDEADRIYQATGVWLRSPRLPLMPGAEDLAALAIGETDAARPDDALAGLAVGPGLAPDAGLPEQPVPPAAGTVFDRDARGIIIAQPQGTLLPTGTTVFAAPPPRVPPTRPGTPPPPPEVVAAAAIQEAGVRPQTRPAGVIAAAVAAGVIDAAPDEAGSAEAAPPDAAAAGPAAPPTAEGSALAEEVAGALARAPTAGGVSLAAFDGVRPETRPPGIAPPEPWSGPAPQIRPDTLAPDFVPPETDAPPLPEDEITAALSAIVAAAPDPLAGVSEQAVPMALRPDARPRNFASVVQTQQERLARAQQQAAAAAVAAAPVAAAEPAAASQTGGVGTANLSREEQAEDAPEISNAPALPTGDVPGGVASAATIADAINLREINVIGVFGSQSNRRALVRLANGRIMQVSVGDSLDGGQVVAIGDDFLNYSKRGQTLTLQVPGG